MSSLVVDMWTNWETTQKSQKSKLHVTKQINISTNLAMYMSKKIRLIYKFVEMQSSFNKMIMYKEDYKI